MSYDSKLPPDWGVIKNMGEIKHPLACNCNCMSREAIETLIYETILSLGLVPQGEAERFERAHNDRLNRLMQELADELQ